MELDVAPPAFEIARAESGALTASNGTAALVLMDDDGRLFRRRAVRGLGGPNPEPIEWAVAELDGVFVYFDGLNVVVSRRALRP